MAPPKHPENFVSYRASTVGLSSIVSDLERVETALDRSTTAVDRANLKSQATLLRIQAAVTEGDAHFDKRRFDQALSSYQDAGKLILTLIDPQMGSKRAPRTWLDTPAIAQSLQQVSSGLLGNLIPAAMTASPVALTKPIDALVPGARRRPADDAGSGGGRQRRRARVCGSRVDRGGAGTVGRGG